MNQLDCPLCDYGHSKTRTRKPWEMTRHFRYTHWCIDLLNEGIETHKIRRSTMTRYERFKTAQWLETKGFIIITQMPPEKRFKPTKTKEITDKLVKKTKA